MTPRRLFVLASLAAVTIFLFAAQAVDAHGNDVKLEAKLVPTAADPKASGDAQFQSEQNRDGTIRRQFEVNIQDVSSADSVRVLVNGAQVGPVIKIGGYRRGGELKLDTENGDVVPVLKAGDVVQVVNAANGTLILQGTLVEGRRR
jgi:hypothetical protein